MSQATLRDLCAEAVAVEGTGAGVFLGAMRGHRSFAEAYAGVLPLAGVNLKIEEANAQGYIVRWEHSTCTVTETGFTRVTCVSSSNNNNFVEFGTDGYKRAFVFIPVADLGSGGGAVTSVAGRTGAVTLSASDISGLGTAATTAASAYATAAQGTDDRTASGLRTATTVVSVSAAAAPSSGQVLTATGSAAATWQTPSGSPGGASTNIQYNFAGAFGGSPDLTFDPTTKNLIHGGTTVSNDYASNGLLHTYGGIRCGTVSETAGIFNGCGYFSGTLEVNGAFLLRGAFQPALGVFIALSASGSGATCLYTAASGDSSARYDLTIAGAHRWGSGTGAADVTLQRNAAGRLTCSGVLGAAGLKLDTFTVGTLPIAPSFNDRYTVTNALAPALYAVVVAGGSALADVKWNGSNWIVCG